MKAELLILGKSSSELRLALPSALPPSSLCIVITAWFLGQWWWEPVSLRDVPAVPGAPWGGTLALGSYGGGLRWVPCAFGEMICAVSWGAGAWHRYRCRRQHQQPPEPCLLLTAAVWGCARNAVTARNWGGRR